MVTIEEVDGKLKCWDDETKNEFIFEDVLAMKNFIENLTNKFDRYMKGVPGFENRKWFGIYSTCPNEIFPEVLKIMEKHTKQIENEIKIIEDIYSMKPDKKKKIIIQSNK